MPKFPRTTEPTPEEVAQYPGVLIGEWHIEGSYFAIAGCDCDGCEDVREMARNDPDNPNTKWED